MPAKVYIGDSVYATESDHVAMWAGVMLTTENGLPGDPSNSIYLEPEVIQALLSLPVVERYVIALCAQRCSP